MMTGSKDKLKETDSFSIIALPNSASVTPSESKPIELLKPVKKENPAEVMKYHVREKK